MKLTELLMVMYCVIVVVAGSNSGNEKSVEKSGDKVLLERASAQLERLDPYRLSKESVDRIDKNLQEISTLTTAPSKSKMSPKDSKDARPAMETFQLLSGDDLQKLIETTQKIDKNRVVIELMADPKYAAMMQERNKRGSDSGSGGSASIFTGIASGLLGGISSASKGSSSSSSSSSSSHPGYKYGPPQPYGEKTFGIWDFKKAIFNTLFQAFKAIGGGVIALKGHLIKGGGYLVSATGKIISKTGEVTASLGKNIASSAVIAPPKEQYGPPGYAYNVPEVGYAGHDATYDGPPPTANDYAVPGTGYDSGHSGYASPSDDDDHSGILHVGLRIPTKTETVAIQNNEHQLESSHGQQHLTDLENSFGGTTSVKKEKIRIFLTSVPTGINSQPQTQENHVDTHPSYDHTNLELPEHKFQSLPHHDYQQHHDDHLTIQQSLEYPPLHLQQVQLPESSAWPLDLKGHSAESGGLDFYSDFQVDLGPQYPTIPNFGHHGSPELVPIKPHVDFHNLPAYPSVHVSSLRLPAVGPMSHQFWQGNALHGYGHVIRRRKSNPYKRRFVRAVNSNDDRRPAQRERIAALRR